MKNDFYFILSFLMKFYFIFIFHLTKFHCLIALTVFDILDNVCFVIVCFQDWDNITFKVNLIFLIKLIFYMTKKSRQKFTNWALKMR